MAIDRRIIGLVSMGQGWRLAFAALIVVLAFTAAFGRLSAAVDAKTSIAFVGVTVIPMDREETLPDQTVLIQAGKIVAVGPTKQTALPHDAIVIDGKGRFLMPGLADMHVHLEHKDFFLLFLRNGVTSIRNMWGTPFHQSLQTLVERGDIPGPTIYTTGPIIDGSPRIWPQSKAVRTAEEARIEVRRQKADGYEALKVYENLSWDAYDALTTTAKETGMRIEGHVPMAVGVEHALVTGQHSIEHLSGYIWAVKRDDFEVTGTGRRWRLKAAYAVDPQKIKLIALASKESGVWNCVTLIVTQRFADTVGGFAPTRLSRPEMRFVPPWIRARWDPKKDFRMQHMGRGAVRDMRKASEVNTMITSALRDAGAGILLGTDAPNPLIVPGFAIHDELENLVRAGLSPYEALRTGTVNAASALERAGEFGVVKSGSRADLLLLEANPLNDLSTLQNPVGVMARGHWFNAAELDARLEALATKYAAHEGN